MFEREILDFANTLGLDTVKLQDSVILSFTLDNKYIFTLESQDMVHGRQRRYIYSMRVYLNEYEMSLMTHVVSQLSSLKSDKNYALGYGNNHVIFLVSLDESTRATDLEDLTLYLKDEFDAYLKEI